MVFDCFSSNWVSFSVTNIQIYRRCMVKASDLLSHIDIAYTGIDPRVCMLFSCRWSFLALDVVTSKVNWKGKCEMVLGCVCYWELVVSKNGGLLVLLWPRTLTYTCTRLNNPYLQLIFKVDRLQIIVVAKKYNIYISVYV